MQSFIRGKIKSLATTIAVAVLGVGLLPIGLPQVAAAGSASFSLTPASGTYTVGDTFTVKIYENSAEPVLGVAAHINYDKASLEFVSLDGGQSGFTTAMPSSAGNGVVKINRAIMGGSLQGNQLVSTVTFKTIAVTNRSAITFLPTSAIAASGGRDLWNGNTAGAAYILKAPASSGGGTSTPTPTPTPSPASGGSAGGSSSGGSSTPAPGGGSSSSGGTSSGSSSSGATGGEAPAPSPSTQTASPTSIETTELLAPSTFFVAVQILDEAGNIVSGAVVTLDDGQKVKTDSKGIASFMNVTSGEHTVTVDHDGKKRSEKIAVQQTGNEATMPQQFKLKLSSSADQIAKPFWIIYLTLAVIVLGTAGVLFPRRPHFATDGMNAPESKNIVTSDFNSHPSAGNTQLHQPGTVIAPTNNESTPKEQPSDDEQKPSSGTS